MSQQLALASVTATVMALSFSIAQSASPNGVKTLDPPGAIKAEGTWSLGARAGAKRMAAIKKCTDELKFDYDRYVACMSKQGESP